MNISELKNKDTNSEVTNLMGWVSSVRDHGNLIFIELRDTDSRIQLVLDAEKVDLDTFKSEYYISIDGLFIKRDPEMINDSQPLGEFEINVKNFSILSKSNTLPFQLDDSLDTDENIRLKYRYLDLRREDMKKNIITRSKTFRSIRESMNELGFLELDTPTLTKSTPEGAKDFLVPSRKQNGAFYALPQSPQMYKQLFMVSGFDKYYQIAKCYRDEDSRKDRQPEFTQLDLEISNGSPEIVREITESIVKKLLTDVYELEVEIPFIEMTYDEAINTYGTDKPDLRIKSTIKDFTNIFKKTEIKFIKSAIENNGFVKGFVTEDILSRSQIDELDEIVKDNGSNGLGWFKIENNEVSGPLSKIITDDERNNILKLGEGMLIFQSGTKEIYPILDILRRSIFKPDDTLNFLWIYDFPYFETEDGEIQPSHHPFTSPKDVDSFVNEPSSSKALHYDLVLNGSELGSGSQRINDPSIQTKVLEMWGLSESDINNRFGWFIEALSYGTPQHAGIALGIDRFVAVMLNTESIRDVIPFPKTQSGLDPLTGAPSVIFENELTEYNLKYIEEINEE
jgi:aspartyl-tRNA synthetase